MASTQKPECGDLIKISRGGYQHWAVYIGEGEVVHIVKPAVGQAKVKRENLMDVVGNDGYSVHNYLDAKYEHLHPDEIRKKALSHVGEERPYNVVTQNCEHFATDMRYGKPESRQVKVAGFIGVAFILVTAVFTAGISEIIRSRKQKAALQKAKQRWIRQPKVIGEEVPGQCPCEEQQKRSNKATYEEEQERVELEPAEIPAQHYRHLYNS